MYRTNCSWVFGVGHHVRPVAGVVALDERREALQHRVEIHAQVTQRERTPVEQVAEVSGEEARRRGQLLNDRQLVVVVADHVRLVEVVITPEALQVITTAEAERNIERLRCTSPEPEYLR